MRPDTQARIAAFIPDPDRAAHVRSILTGSDLLFLPDFADRRVAVGTIADSLARLLIVDLTDPIAWLGEVRSDPATRRLPMIVFGSGDELATRAKAYQANAVLSLAELDEHLTPTIARHTRAAPTVGGACDEPLPDLVRAGLEQFNAREYFEAHETLEAAWNAETRPVRDTYRAILQIAVAYLHITRRNYPGALKMFLRSNQWFYGLPDRCHGIDLAQLQQDAAAIRAQLELLGADRISEMDPASLPPIRYTAANIDNHGGNHD